MGVSVSRVRGVDGYGGDRSRGWMGVLEGFNGVEGEGWMGGGGRGTSRVRRGEGLFFLL